MTRSRTGVHVLEARAAEQRSGWATFRRGASEPLVPVAILALGLAVGVSLQAWAFVWVGSAAVAGYAVSGSP